MIITDEHKGYLLGGDVVSSTCVSAFCDGGVCPHFRGRSLAEIDRTVSIEHLFRIRESGRAGHHVTTNRQLALFNNTGLVLACSH